MLTLNWIGKEAVVKHHKEVPYRLLVPVICLYEVFKRILQQRDEHSALRAAKQSIEYKLPMADAIILATAQAFEAVIWTQDADIKNIEGVKYFSKRGQ